MSKQYVTISANTPQYPERLRNVLGNTLCAIGNIELLGQPAIGICGSRDASLNAQDWALRFGQEAANRGFLVVSGYARGIDRQAHKGTLEAGGSTIAVLPEGIEGFAIRRELTNLVEIDKNFLAVSMFDPNAPWKAWRAMERNKLIVGLSSGLFVVEARETGGTINAAMECVRQQKPLWAIAYSKLTPERGGNELLLQDAAIPLTKMKDVKLALDSAKSRSAGEFKQLALGMAGV